jgi:hypothetical protein
MVVIFCNRKRVKRIPINRESFNHIHGQTLRYKARGVVILNGITTVFESVYICVQLDWSRYNVDISNSIQLVRNYVVCPCNEQTSIFGSSSPQLHTLELVLVRSNRLFFIYEQLYSLIARREYTSPLTCHCFAKMYNTDLNSGTGFDYWSTYVHTYILW